MTLSSPFGTPIAPLLLTVFKAILEVFILCLAGYVLAKRGVLDKKTQKQLNRLNVSLFTPSLLFSKVAFSLTPAKLRELWIIPISFVIITALSMGVAFVMGCIFGLRRSQRNFAMAASMFMHANSIPISLMQSLVVTVPGLKWGLNDNKDAMLGRSLTYLLMHSTLGMMLRWSYGVKLLASADDELVVNPNIQAIPFAEVLPVYDADRTPQDLFRVSSGEGSGDTDGHPANERSALLFHPPSHPSHLYHSFASSSSQSQRGSASGRFTPTDSTDMTAEDELPSVDPAARRQYIGTTEPTSTHLQSFRQLEYRICQIWLTIKDVMTAPLWAGLASFIVAWIPPLQHALNNHMPAVKGALNAAGNCSIPLTLVVLGAYFYEPPRIPAVRAQSAVNWITTRNSSSSSILNVKRLLNGGATDPVVPERPDETKTVVVAVLSRMVIAPLLLLPMIVVLTSLNVQPLLEDPVFIISNMLVISSPPGLVLAQITQATAGDALERLISRTLFWSYCVLTPPTIVIYVVIGLLLTKLQS